MYKITKNIDNLSYIEIQQGINPEFNLTYEEVERRNTKNSDIGIKVFFQEELPPCESKYWKIFNGEVIEMSTEEKTNIDILEEYNRVKTEQEGYRYKITVGNDINSLYPTGVVYFTAKTTVGIDIFDFNYRVLDKWIMSRDGYTVKQYATNEEEIVVLCNELTPSFISMIENDARITIFDVETLKQ